MSCREIPRRLFFTKRLAGQAALEIEEVGVYKP